MKILDRLKSLMARNSHYLKVAFVSYPLSSVLWSLNALVFSMWVFEIIQRGGDYYAYAFIITLLAMALEALSVWNLACQKFGKSFHFAINHIVNLALLVVLGTLISLFITQPMLKEVVPFYSVGYFIGLHMSLCVVFFTLFTMGNLKENERSLFAFGAFSVIMGLFVLLVVGLTEVFMITFDFLFETKGDFLWQLYGAFSAIFSTLGGLIFVGKMASLNHCSVKVRESAEFGESKILNYLLNILNAFGYVYATLLLVFFATLALGISENAPSSVVHLIIWFSFFGLILVWVNDGYKNTKIAESSVDSINSTKCKISWQNALKLPKSRQIFITLLFVLNLIAIYSIIIRLNEYGITPNRLFVALGCVYLFISLIVSFISLGRVKILLGIFAFLVLFGGIFVAPISIKSQLSRLESLSLESKNYEEIRSIYLFLDRYKVENLEKYRDFLGENSIEYEVSDEVYNKPRHNYYRELDTNYYIKGYSIFFAFKPIRDGYEEFGDYAVEYDKNFNLTINNKKSGESIRLQLDEVAKKTIECKLVGEYNSSIKNNGYEFVRNDTKYKIIFKEASVMQDESDGKCEILEVDDIKFWLLIGENSKKEMAE